MRCAKSSACRPTRSSTCRRWRATPPTMCRAFLASAARPAPTQAPRKLGGRPPVPSEATPQTAAMTVANAVRAQGIDRTKYETITDLPRLEAWMAEARAAGHFAFDTETTSLDPMQAE